MTDSIYDNLGDMRLMLMTTMAEMGISAEEYDSFLKSDIDREKIKKAMLDMSDYPLTMISKNMNLKMKMRIQGRP